MSKPEEGKGESLESVSRVREEERDVEELKEVLKAVSEFLKELSPTLKGILETILGTLRGDALGKETGEFYKSLIEAGMKEEVATRLAEEFLRNKMAMVNVANILSQLSQTVPKKEVKEEIIEKKTAEEKSG